MTLEEALRHRRFAVMKARTQFRWSVEHPGPVATQPGVLGPMDALRHIQEHFPEMFAQAMKEANSIKKENLN